MKGQRLLKSILVSAAIILLVLVFSALLGKTDTDSNSLTFYFYVFLGRDILSYIFILILSAGYVCALQLIFRDVNPWSLTLFLPSVLVLAAIVTAGVVMYFAFSYGIIWYIKFIADYLFYFIKMLIRVFLSAIIMLGFLAIVMKMKKSK